MPHFAIMLHQRLPILLMTDNHRFSVDRSKVECGVLEKHSTSETYFRSWQNYLSSFHLPANFFKHILFYPLVILGIFLSLTLLFTVLMQDSSPEYVLPFVILACNFYDATLFKDQNLYQPTNTIRLSGNSWSLPRSVFLSLLFSINRSKMAT